MNETHFTEKDRELLTLLAERVTNLTQAVERLQAKLDNDVYIKKSDAVVCHTDFEQRIRRLETWGFGAIGALAVVEFIFRFLID